MQIKNIFNKGRMNKDVDERLVPNGEYTDALNIRVTNTDDSDSGTVQNEKGNTKLTRINVSGNPRCIGSVSDEANEQIYWFVVNDSGHSFIFEYDAVNDVTSTVLSDTRTGSAQVLGFDKQYKITGANVVYNKTTDETLLFFTDNLNPPRMVNVNRAKAYGSGNFVEDDINLYKKPPRKAPSVLGFNTATAVENGVSERFFAFAYRYKYLDNQYSALSAFTQYQFTPGLFDLNFSTFENEGMVNQFNGYNITYNTGDKRVTDIQLCFKSPLSGEVFIIDTINKKENDYIDDVERTYTFINNKVYQALPDDELNRVFDNVPLKALAQDVIEDRLVFGNYTTQYDIKENESDEGTIAIDYEAEQLSFSRSGEEGTYTRASSNTQIKLDFSGFDLFKGYRISLFADIESPSTGSPAYFDGSYAEDLSFVLSQNYANATALYNSDDFDEFLKAMSADFAKKVSTTSPADTVTPITYGSFTKTAVSGNVITITAPVNTHTVDNTPLDNTDNDFTDNTETFTWNDTSEFYVYESANNLSLKSNRAYDFGIVYLDKYGRYSTVIANSDDDGSEKSSFFVPVRDSVNINKAKITIKHKPPYWADRYKFFVKQNKGLHYNVFGSVNYQEGLYMWVLLNGANAKKVEQGMSLLVKSDDNGPISTLRKIQVLEVTTKSGADAAEGSEGWIDGNEDSDGNPIKEINGTYMKIRPEGFVYDYKPSNYITYDGGGRVGTWVTIAANGSVQRSLGTGDDYASVILPQQDASVNAGIMQQYDGTNYSDVDLNAGDSIYIKMSSNNLIDLDGDEIHFYEAQFVVRNDYENTSGGVNALHKWLQAETTWSYDSSTELWTTPNDEFTWKLRTDSSGRRRLEVTTTQQTRRRDGYGTIEATINIQKNNGVVVFETDPTQVDTPIYYETEDVFDIVNGLHKGNVQDQTSSVDAEVELSFGNCFSFGNGVESVSIRDSRFEEAYAIDLRPNIALTDGFKEQTVKHGLIYSGSFNENTSYNSLNEFNASRGNTEFMDIKYGSIQKLFARETDLLVFQEDQVSKILFGKNLIQGADGSGSLVQIEQVLGQTVPFAGEYGIAKNPESFAEYGGRIYFTDSNRGAVLRLGANGIQPISDLGMKNYFRTNLPLHNDKYNIGGYDAKYNKYVLSYNQSAKSVTAPIYDCASQFNRMVIAQNAFTYTVDVGDNAGTLSIAYDIDGDSTDTVDIDVTYAGTTTNNAGLSGTGTLNQVITSANLANHKTASVTVTGSSTNVRAEVNLTHTCPTEGTREVIIYVMNDVNDAGKTIINRYKVNSGNYYQKVDTFSTSGIARDETLLAIKSNAFIPRDQDTVTLSSYRINGIHDGFFNSCSRIGYMVTDAVKTAAQVQAGATYLTETDSHTNAKRETTGSFTFSPSDDDDKLYLIFDYQDGSCTPTDEAQSQIDEEQGQDNPA